MCLVLSHDSAAIAVRVELPKPIAVACCHIANEPWVPWSILAADIWRYDMCCSSGMVKKEIQANITALLADVLTTENVR